jgi:hypothetical protein
VFVDGPLAAHLLSVAHVVISVVRSTQRSMFGVTILVKGSMACKCDTATKSETNPVHSQPSAGYNRYELSYMQMALNRQINHGHYDTHPSAFKETA